MFIDLAELRMEMPIWAMITLLIAVMVGMMVLMFGSEWIGKAGDQFKGGLDGSDKTNRFIRQPTISDSQIAMLIEQCYNESAGKKLESDVCFSVTVDNPVVIEEGKIAPLVKNLDSSKFAVNNATTSSFSIIWNYTKGIVEVKT